MYLQRKGPTRQQGTRPGRRRTTGRVAVATHCARRHLHMSARRCRRPLPLSASDPWWPGRRIFFRSAGLAITASRAPGPESQYPRGQRRVAAVPARVKATLPLLLRGFSVSPQGRGTRRARHEASLSASVPPQVRLHLATTSPGVTLTRREEEVWGGHERRRSTDVAGTGTPFLGVARLLCSIGGGLFSRVSSRSRENPQPAHGGGGGLNAQLGVISPSVAAL